MKLNKIKTILSLATLKELKCDFKFFTVEKSSSTKIWKLLQQVKL